MANSLNNLIPVIFTALDIISREQIGFIPNVFRNASAERAAINQDITYPIAPASTAQDITPAVTAPNAGDQVIGNASLKITKARAVPIRWNGEEQRGASNAGFYAALLQDQFVQGFRAMTNEVEADLAGMYVKASRAYGTAGSTPFSTPNDFTDIAETLQILSDNGAGKSDLNLILGSSAATRIRGKQTGLFKVNEAGTDALLRTGIIGPLEGFNIGESSQIKPVAKGTGVGYLVNGACPVGTNVIACDTGTGTILAGDVVSLKDDTNKYVVRKGLSGGSFEIAAPGLLQPLGDNAEITVGGNFTPNMAFRKQAIHLITRAPAMPIGPDGKAMDMAEDVMIVTDPFSGIAFEVSVYKQFRQLVYYIGLAWGVGNVKSEHTALLLG